MCVRAVQFNMEKTDEKTGPARAEVGGGGGGGRRTEAEMQAAPCESLGTTTLLGGVECRWLPYPTGQPVKLRYHLTRTLRPCTTNIYIYLNLRRWTFQRYLRVMIHLFSLSICEFSLSRFRKFFLYFFRFLPFSSSFSFKEEEEEEDGFALLANR